MRTFTRSIETEYQRYRTLAEKAMEQLSDQELARRAGDLDNSVAMVAWHVGGNLRSRFTEFLTTDGEKPWRDRESEFRDRGPDRAAVMHTWNAGWDTLLATLGGLADGDLADTVTIRGQPLTVVEALHRSLAHTAYHVGQIVALAKAMRGSGWTWLSIPPARG